MGELHCIGYNDEGQLGLGDWTTRTSLTQVGTIETWDEVYCLQQSTMAIRTDGTLWVTGENNFGQLGLGDKTNRNAFTRVGSDSNWSKLIKAGSWHVLAIKTDGTLWSCGRNDGGQLGLGDTTDITTFAQVGSDTNWAEIAAAEGHSLAIKTNGTLWACGHNDEGQLGLGGGADESNFTQVGQGTSWTKVSCGTSYSRSLGHSLAIKTDGTLWACGFNDQGQLGLGNTASRDTFEQVGTGWAEVACGRTRTHALKTTGTLWACGDNSKGELGVGDTSDKYDFTQVGLGTDWTAISETASYFCLALQTYNLYGTGKNNSDQLLLGDTEQHNSFTASSQQTCEKIACNAGNSTYMGFTFIIKATPTLGNHRSISGIDSGVLFAGKTLIGDRSNGKIYYLDMDTYTDNDLPISRVRRTQIINKEKLNVLHNRVEIEFEPGVGLDVAAGVDGQDPQATLKWSDDGGNTWSSGRSVDIGEYQQYGTRAVWRRLGKSRNRIYELTIEEPVKIILIGAYSNIKACAF